MVNITAKVLFFLSLTGFVPSDLLAQEAVRTQPKPRTTVFIPLMLDSVVVDGKPIFTKSMPASMSNALDFFNGMQIATQDLEAQGIAARIQVIDSKSANSFEQYFRDTTFEGTGIVISAAQSAAEFKAIADKLRPLAVPLISILPNDAGVSAYPQMMLVNTTLRTHCYQVVKFLQRYHAIDNLLLLDIAGTAETRLKQYLKDANSETRAVPLGWKETIYGEDFTAESLVNLLDSNRMNVLVAPTLNGANAQHIVKMLSTLAPKYRATVVGMPTWESVSFTKSEYKGVDVWYGTPFVTAAGNATLNDEFVKKYKALTNSLPGDMAYRGYELSVRYVKTHSVYGKKFIEHINDYRFKQFNEFNFQPVSVRENGQTDYLENQKVYFVKKTDGIIQTVLTP
jgi:hypothetical protein